MNTLTKWTTHPTLSTLTISAMLSSVLIGCGGGGSDSSEGPQTDSSAIETPIANDDTTLVEEIPVPKSAPETATLRSMQDLTVPADFDYDPTRSKSLIVDIGGFSTERAYISLYSQYKTTDDGRYIPDYSYRIANSSLTKGAAEIDITYAQQYSSLLAEIWFYDGSEPLQYIINEDQNTILY
ncbi:hypothetical protein VHA01S_019_00070 [Vibrio halioticoli NBRC 102217]|uniref:Lipoprotein n=1 Tax=Vibrio halioticoli NBRC 102217 TaxID=1219072 RepID=V5HJ55_9VIBR|nr:hypothetical protein [Vibrio halioticoli]GAD89330.1 hypothetical protein VHA01S_019_00070 [Vibrio halioticoli NBRC 102217]